jgi:hypothetical protein
MAICFEMPIEFEVKVVEVGNGLRVIPVGIPAGRLGSRRETRW